MKTHRHLFFLICLFFLFTQSLIAQEPAFEWVTHSSSSGYFPKKSIDVDAIGNVYIGSSFKDTVEIRTGSNPIFHESEGGNDILIQKLDAEGYLIWSKQIGGMGEDRCNGISVDIVGNIYITGFFKDTVDFDPSSNYMPLISNGKEDIFIQKLDPNGNLIWVKQIGNTSEDFGNDIAVDIDGNIIITGQFDEIVDLNPGPETLYFNSLVYGDAFILKLNPQGNLIWAKQLVGQESEGELLSLDPLGNIYITGRFYEIVDFDPGSGIYELWSGYNGNDHTTNAFILKLDAQGDFKWAKEFGTDYNDLNISAAAGSSQNVYITGSSTKIIDLDPGFGQDTFYMYPVGQGDAYLIKLDINGEFVWANQIGGYGYVRGESVAIDEFENIYTTGRFSDTIDFNPSLDSLVFISKGDRDIFIQKLDSAGNHIWSKNIGGIGRDAGTSIIIDEQFNIYTLGYFRDTVDFNPGIDTFHLNSIGSSDVFVHKMSQCETSININADGDTHICQGESITLTAGGGENYLWNTGDTTASVTFFPTTTNNYSVIVSDSLGCYGSATIQITVEPLPTAQFDYAANGTTVEFTNFSSSSAINFQWDFGDGSPFSFEENPIHTYNQPGVYLVTLVATNPHCGSAISQNVDVLSTTNYDFEKEMKIELHPNPTTGIITIHLPENLENAKLEIKNYAGKSVMKQHLKNDTTIDLTDFASGVYFLQIQAGDALWIEKVVKL